MLVQSLVGVLDTAPPSGTTDTLANSMKGTGSGIPAYENAVHILAAMKDDGELVGLPRKVEVGAIRALRIERTAKQFCNTPPAFRLSFLYGLVDDELIPEDE